MEQINKRFQVTEEKLFLYILTYLRMEFREERFLEKEMKHAFDQEKKVKFKKKERNRAFDQRKK